MSPEVDALARLAAAGDAVALERLLTLVRPDVLRLCARFLPCVQDAEDACQETLLAVSRSLPSWRGEAAFSTWLYRVSANCARSTYRSLRRRAAERPTLAPIEVADPRTTSVVAGTRLDLLDGLDAVGGDLAEAVALRDLLDLGYREIAALQGVPEGTVKSRVHEGRRRLRDRLM